MKVGRWAPLFSRWSMILVIMLLAFSAVLAEEQSISSSLFPDDTMGAFLKGSDEKGKNEQEIYTWDRGAYPADSIFRFQSQMREIDLELERLQRNLDLLKQNRTLKSKLGISSETRFYSTMTPGNGATPRVYSKLMFRPPVEGNTVVYSALYLQSGPGSTVYNSQYLSPLRLSTRFNWNNNIYELTTGRLIVGNTHFTISRPYRLESTWRETRHYYNGVQLSSRILGFNWTGFIAREVDGNGSRYDRYTLFSSAVSPVKGGEIGLTLLKVFDDMSSAPPVTGGVYDSTTVGLSFRYRGALMGTNFEVSGEGNINRLDEDKTCGPFASTEYALRATGKVSLKLPLEFLYYDISRDYPITNTAIQPLSSDFIWMYEENPWYPYYLSNLKYLQLSTTPLALGNWGSLAASGTYARENTATGQNVKTFKLGNCELTADLARLVSFPLAQGTKISAELYFYNTFSAGTIDLWQKIGRLGVLRPVLPNASLELGYEHIHFNGKNQDISYDQLQYVPFAIGNFLIGRSTLEWKYYPIFQSTAPVEHRHKLEWKSSIGPYTSLRLVYELTRSEQLNRNERLAVEYWSGF